MGGNIEVYLRPESRESYRVDINEEERSARVIVPDFQLSLAIGKGRSERKAGDKAYRLEDNIRANPCEEAIKRQMFNRQ